MDFHNSSDEFGWWDVISNVYLRGKRTPEEVKNHYYKLVHDVNAIENGEVCVPKYKDDNYENYDNGQDSFIHNNAKYTQWSKDEHRLFLIGEVIYGGGDWRSIARMIVKTRSSTQVASHAQKFHDREKKPKNTKRASIHDITTVDHETALDLHQRKLLSFENFQTYLGKLASKTDQQGVRSFVLSRRNSVGLFHAPSPLSVSPHG
uniref:Uncharacterized protein n=1 Tax=Chenopodium quinoa TaxID=63459 RepID=A0A803N1X0_CHEQI